MIIDLNVVQYVCMYVEHNCGSFLFTVVPCVLILLKFYHQQMHKRIALKGVLKFTLKQLQHVSV